MTYYNSTNQSIFKPLDMKAWHLERYTNNNTNKDSK